MKGVFRFLYPLIALAILALATACATKGDGTPVDDAPAVGHPTSSPGAVAQVTSPIYAVAFVDTLHGWAGGKEGIFGTANGGQTWTKQYVDRESIIQLNSVDLNNVWALTSAGTLLRTKNGGAEWEQATPTVSSFHLVDFMSSTRGFATDGSTLFVTQDGASTWTKVEAPVPIASLDFVDEQNGWIAGSGKAWHTSDNGITWHKQLDVPGGDLWQGPTWIRFVSKANGWILFTLGQGFASQEPYVLYRTQDGGQTWTPVMVTGGSWIPQPNIPRPEAASGPGGYPTAVAAQGSTAWVIVDSLAGAYLDVVQIEGEGLAPISKGRIPFKVPRPLVMGISFVNHAEGWMATGDAPSGQSHLLHTLDGGATWKTDN